jgi:hypothetical protein
MGDRVRSLLHHPRQPTSKSNTPIYSKAVINCFSLKDSGLEIAYFHATATIQASFVLN